MPSLRLPDAGSIDDTHRLGEESAVIVPQSAETFSVTSETSLHGYGCCAIHVACEIPSWRVRLRRVRPSSLPVKHVRNLMRWDPACHPRSERWKANWSFIMTFVDGLN